VNASHAQRLIGTGAVTAQLDPGSSSLQIEPQHDGVKVDGMSAITEGIASAEMNVLPCYRRCRRRDGQRFLVPGSLGLDQQARKDRRVVEDDRVTTSRAQWFLISISRSVRPVSSFLPEMRDTL